MDSSYSHLTPYYFDLHHRRLYCDLVTGGTLILDGTCVTNEAVLTGETLPQSKVPLDLEEDAESNSCGSEASDLDMIGKHRNSILFAGTIVLYSHVQQQRSSRIPGVKCVVLKTGFYSSRGDLMRALHKSRVGVVTNPQTEKDALRLILSLSAFAGLAGISLSGSGDPEKTSAFRRVIQCTRIAVASIPFDIPLALSSVACNCAMWLRNDSDVACSEPGALLTAAMVDLVVFYKTATITADT